MKQTNFKSSDAFRNGKCSIPFRSSFIKHALLRLNSVKRHVIDFLNYQKRIAVIAMLSFVMFFVQNSNASHVSGGQIYYTSQGNNNYLISLSIYRDCAGITPGSSYTLSVLLGNASFANPIANLVSTTDISIVCPGQQSTCNGGTLPGLQEWLYQVTVNMPPAPGLIYTISLSDCCRSSSITNLANPAGDGIYLETKLDPNLAYQNSSPRFLQPPPAYFCLNQPGSFVPNGYDIDGDSIAYSLVNARIDPTISVVYTAGLSGTTPLLSSTPVTIDAQTGLVTFTSSALQIAVIAIKMQEYRNLTLISEVYREFTVMSINCGSNVPPAIGAVTNGSATVGVPYTQVITSTDANVTQNITLTASAGVMPPATLTVNSAVPGATSSTFSFTPTNAHAGRSFSVAITATDDNNCPPISSMALFKINVAGLNFNTGNVPSVNCAGGSISVPYSSTLITFNPGNVFTAQLSDATGSFALPVNIGTLAGTAVNGLIPSIIPSNSPSGSQYLVRIVSTNPVDTAGDNGFYFTVNPATTLTASATPSTVYSNATPFQLSVSPTATVSSGYSVSAITYAPVTSGTTNPGPNSDDILSASIPIGFNFPFYNNTYSNVYISSNGFITFNSISSSGCCAGELIPSSSNPNLNDLIAVCWTDLYPVAPSTIDYFNLTSPNRFVVRYNGVFHCCGSNVQATAQIILYDDGTIEMHNTTINPDGIMTQGIENSTGTLATVVPGRNASTWNAVNDAYRFVPALLIPPGYSWQPVLNMDNPVLPSPTVSGIASTTVYTVSYINPNGCTSSASTTVTYIDPVDITCPSNQTAYTSGACNAVVNYTVSSSGTPVPALTYAFTGATTLSGTGDGSGSTFNTGTTSVTITASNINGSQSCSFDVTVIDNQPPDIATCPANTTVAVNSSNCTYGGSIGLPTATDNCSALITRMPAGNLPKGVTNVTWIATDPSGNSLTCSQTVTVTSPVINASVAATPVTCKGSNSGSINLSASGSSGPFTFLWNTGSTNEDAGNLYAGNYTVIISDVSGCSASVSASVSQPSVLMGISMSKTNVRCGGKATGNATAIPSGGTAPYSYLWEDNSINATRNNLPAATYTVTVTDANGCIKTKSVTISENSPMTLFAVQTGFNEATATAGGGVPAYAYLWNTIPAQTNAVASGLAAGTFKVKVTDSKGCTKTTNVSVSPTKPSDENESIYVYPNPTDGKVNLIVSCTTCDYIDVKIFNAIGEKLLDERRSMQQLQFDMSYYTKGVYLFDVMAGDKRKAIKVVIE